jgi:hypothetical protein
MSHLQIVIDSRGGGGHISVGQSATAEWSSKGANHITNTIDFLGQDIIGSVNIPFIGSIGDFAVYHWNNAQISGNVSQLKNTADLRWFSDLIFYPIAIRKFTEYLRSLDDQPEQIISSQALCIDALAQAILTVNKERKWNMKLQVHMSDLPTEKAEHFYKSLRNIGYNKKLSEIVTLYSPTEPQCQTGETSANFWKRHIGDIKVLYFDKIPIRKSFFENHCTIGKDVDLSLRLNHSNELTVLKLGTKNPAFPDQLGQNKIIDFHVGKNDKIATLMLGSQPPKNAINDYVHAFIKGAAAEKAALNDAAAKKNLPPVADEDLPKYNLFIFCGRPESLNDKNQVNEILRKLEKDLRSYSKENKAFELPSNLRIIPFTHQDDKTLAPLLHRSNLTITKSGGSTCFELIQLNQDHDHQSLNSSERRNVFIHSEGLLPTPNYLTVNLEGIWKDIVKVIKWLFNINDYPTEKDIYPTGLNKKDLYDIEKIWIDCAKKHNFFSYANLDPLLSQSNLVKNEKHTSALYTRFTPINNNYLKNNKSINFNEQDVIKLIVNKTEKLRAEFKKNQKNRSSVPKFIEIHKMAIQKLLIEGGIPLWEAGNAELLQEIMNAKIVNPTYINNFLPGAFFKTPSQIIEFTDSLLRKANDQLDPKEENPNNNAPHLSQ